MAFKLNIFSFNWAIGRTVLKKMEIGLMLGIIAYFLVALLFLAEHPV